MENRPSLLKEAKTLRRQSLEVITRKTSKNDHNTSVSGVLSAAKKPITSCRLARPPSCTCQEWLCG
jgi:hypothetical protein